MDFLRFSSSERYVSQVPLTKLSFSVTVERASIVEEEKRDVLCAAVVPWDAKEYSPQERIDMYKKVSAALQDFYTGRGNAPLWGSTPMTTGGSGGEEADPSRGLLSGEIPSFTALENTISRLLGRTGDIPRRSAVSTALATGPSDAFALPSEAQLVERLGASQSSFFTRPTSEDYIDPTEEDIPVDPPQRFSRLAPLILREHRREHAPNRHMYLMWATGHVAHRPYTTQSSATDTGRRENLNRATDNDNDMEVGALHASESVDGSTTRAAQNTSARPGDNLHWIGDERVMCTLTCERDPHYFTAKPSLFEDHTLMVDSTHIYFVRVVPMLSETEKLGASASPSIVARAPKAKAGRSPVSAPLDLQASRQLSQSVEEDVRRLQRQQLAERDNGRRLLETALLQVPDSGVTATSPGLASDHLPLQAPPRPSPQTIMKVDAHTETGDLSWKARPSSLTPSLMQIHVFGTVERTLSVPYDTVYVRCEVTPEPHAGASADRQSTDDTEGGRGAAPDLAAAYVFRSQMAHVGRVMYEGCLCAPDHVLNLPFQCTYTDEVMPAKPLRMNITVFTEGTGATGHQAAVAYTCAQLPVGTPGRHVVDAPLWAPHKTGGEYVQSAFVGGAPSLVDTRQTGPAAHGTGIGVKQGMVTDSVGHIRLVVNVLHERRPRA